MTAKESLYRTVESLSEEEARRVIDWIGKLHQNGDVTQFSTTELSKFNFTWDDFYADKFPMNPHPYALDLSEVSGDDFIL